MPKSSSNVRIAVRLMPGGASSIGPCRYATQAAGVFVIYGYKPMRFGRGMELSHCKMRELREYGFVGRALEADNQFEHFVRGSPSPGIEFRLVAGGL